MFRMRDINAIRAVRFIITALIENTEIIVQTNKIIDMKWISVKDKLPPYEKEVIALSDKILGDLRLSTNYICFAHRPYPKPRTGKNILTGEVSHYEVNTYDGWNIPGVHHWIPCPKLPE